MNQDIPETYEELKLAFIAECKERYENNETSRTLLGEQASEIAILEREKEELEEEVSLINSEQMENEENIARLENHVQSLESEVECLEKCSLSQEFMEETSAETIKEFEEDCRDNWKELDSLKVKLKHIVSVVYGAVGKEVEFEN